MLQTKFLLQLRLIGIVLFISGLFGLTSCEKATDPDTLAPNATVNLLKSQGNYRFSVTDTITIDFSEKIDTAALALEFTPPEGIAHQFFDEQKLLIFGKNKTYGQTHFSIPAGFTLAMTGLRDQAGNGLPRIENKFLAYKWVDQDFIDTNFTKADSLYKDGATWVDGTPITDSLVTEGNLNYPDNLSREDRQDFKIIQMTAPDTLMVQLNTVNSMNLKCQIAGPFPPENIQNIFLNSVFDSAFYVRQTGTLGKLDTQFVASYQAHHRIVGSPSNPGIYAIRLSIPADQKGFYRLALKLKKFKP